jgi:hypothetical protein
MNFASIFYFAPSGLQYSAIIHTQGVPWAIILCPVGATYYDNHQKYPFTCIFGNSLLNIGSSNNNTLLGRTYGI